MFERVAGTPEGEMGMRLVPPELNIISDSSLSPMNSTTTLDHFRYLHVDKYTDHHTFETVVECILWPQYVLGGTREIVFVYQ
jgi:hypothetical protein